MAKDFKLVTATADLLSELCEDLEKKDEYYNNEITLTLNAMKEFESAGGSKDEWRYKEYQKDLKRYNYMIDAAKLIKDHLQSYKF